ncbi:ATP-binding cassette domain-containing protein [Streptomyces sp. NPDC101219]|uniref:ATP-binding cassette domain-containing protein n=1 Tax=Streptomyces sp. NPDC101219 TaxID=3366131 RepID=UPI00380F1C11
MPPTRHTRRPDVTQLLNFAHGDLYMLGAFAGFAMLSVSAGALGGGLVALVAIMIVAMIATGTLGMVMERVAYRPLRSASRLSVLITAVGASFALEYGIAVAFGPTPEVYQIEVRGGTLNIAGAQIPQAQLAMTAIAVVLMIALDTLVRATRRRCDSEHRPRHQGTGSRLRQGGSPQGLDLTVRENEIVALLGNNGAGKSTTVSAISGLVRPRAGTVSAFGEDITRATPWSIVERGKEKDVSCVGRSRA